MGDCVRHMQEDGRCECKGKRIVGLLNLLSPAAGMCRVISESDEGGGGSSGETGLRSVHRKIKKLFGKVDDEAELMQTTDDFDLEDEESESDTGEEQETGEEQQLYWEVMLWDPLLLD